MPGLEELLDTRIRSVPDWPVPGVTFRDITPLLADPAGIPAVVDGIRAGLDALGIADADMVAGIEARGFVLGAPLAVALGCGFVPVRKQGKLPPPVSSLAYQLEYGSATLEMQPGAGRVVLVDDVMATGGTMRAAAELCQRSGYTVNALVALIDLKLIPRLEWGPHSLRSAIVYD